MKRWIIIGVSILTIVILTLSFVGLYIASPYLISAELELVQSNDGYPSFVVKMTVKNNGILPVETNELELGKTYDLIIQYNGTSYNYMGPFSSKILEKQEIGPFDEVVDEYILDGQINGTAAGYFWMNTDSYETLKFFSGNYKIFALYYPSSLGGREIQSDIVTFSI